MRIFRSIPLGLVELALLVAALGFLCWLGQDLNQAHVIAGRGGRYALALDIPELHRRAAETQWLLQNIGVYFLVVGITGWMTIFIGRRNPRLSVLIVFSGLMWTFAWLAVFSNLFWAIGPVLLFALMLIASARKSHFGWQIPAHPFIYPLFILLTGLGILWLLSFAALGAETVARSYFDWDQGGIWVTKYNFTRLWIGHSQTQSLIIALAALTTIAGISNTLLSRALAWMTASGATARHWPRMGPLGILLLGALVASLGLALFGGVLVTNGKLQLWVWLCAIPLLAWCFIRFRDGADFPRFAKQITLVVALTVFPFLLAKDFGQVLVLSAAIAALSVGLWGMIRNRRGVIVSLATLIGLGLAILLVQFHTWLPDWVTHLSMFDHLMHRIDTLMHPFRGLDDLSFLRWFMHDTPPDGYGLANTPWCGTTDEMFPDKRLCGGMPTQTGTDYVLPALVGVFGGNRAWAIVGGVAFLLLLLCRRAPLPLSHRYSQAQQFGDWISRIFTAFTLSQLFVTVLCTAGLMVLTGISAPLVSYGGALLLLPSIFIGLAINQAKPVVEVPPQAVA